MSTILIVIVLILLLGGGGGYYGYNRYGGSGLGGVLGLVLIVCLALWFLRRPAFQSRLIGKGRYLPFGKLTMLSC